ncbi:MAG TPA: hypothetical protein DDW50_18375 [Firmicutes bacterium]|jgi:biotin carboxylase|nr:hypothetical protein [Bacillota bacterium]
MLLKAPVKIVNRPVGWPKKGTGMLHILFVDSNKLGLQALECAKKRGWYVSFIRSEEFSFFYKHSEAYDNLSHIVDVTREISGINNYENLKKAVIEINSIKKIDFIVTVFEYVILTVAKVAHDLSIPFTNYEGIYNCRNKGALRKILDNANIPSPKSFFSDKKGELLAFADTINFPIILKPNRGSASIYAKRIESRSMLDDCIDDYWKYLNQKNATHMSFLDRNLLIEEYLQGPMLSVEVGLRDNTFFFFAISERARYSKNEVIELGTTMPTKISDSYQKEVFVYCKKVVIAAGLDHGIFHIELIATPNGPRLLELNPRLIGGTGPLLLKNSYGIDIFEILLDIYTDSKVHFADSAPKYYVTSRFLGSEVNFKFAGNYDYSPLTKYGDGLISFNISKVSGELVSRANSNEDYLGFFLCKAKEYESSKHLADTILKEFENIFGVSLIS